MLAHGSQMLLVFSHFGDAVPGTLASMGKASYAGGGHSIGHTHAHAAETKSG
jgi:hypothetical protein